MYNYLNFRTSDSDCCPDYFSHCLGLSEDKIRYATGPVPETILRPPDCPHGVLNISGKMIPSLYLTLLTNHYFNTKIECVCSEGNSSKSQTQYWTTVISAHARLDCRTAFNFLSTSYFSRYPNPSWAVWRLCAPSTSAWWRRMSLLS